MENVFSHMYVFNVILSIYSVLPVLVFVIN